MCFRKMNRLLVWHSHSLFAVRREFFAPAEFKRRSTKNNRNKRCFELCPYSKRAITKRFTCVVLTLGNLSVYKNSFELTFELKAYTFPFIFGV